MPDGKLVLTHFTALCTSIIDDFVPGKLKQSFLRPYAVPGVSKLSNRVRNIRTRGVKYSVVLV